MNEKSFVIESEVKRNAAIQNSESLRHSVPRDDDNWFTKTLDFLLGVKTAHAQVADVIVEETDATTVGSWGFNTWPGGGHNGSHEQANSGSGSVDYGSKVYQPTLVQSGYYNVYYHLPHPRGDLPTQAEYTIYHSYGQEQIFVDQTQGGDTWYLMGEYPFFEGSDGEVKLTNINSDRYTYADAIKFEYSRVLDQSHDFYLFADGLDESVSLSWEMLSGTDEYKVFYGDETGVYDTEVSAGVNNSLTISNLVNASDYYFVIRAYSAGVLIGESNEIHVIPESPNMPNGEIIIDNVQAEKTGTWTAAYWPSPRYNTHYYYAESNSETSTATYRPDITDEGEYEIYQFLPPPASGRSSNVKYTIEHMDGTETLFLSQLGNQGEWNYLGTYNLEEGTTNTVTIHEEDTGYKINAEAVKFVYKGPLSSSNPPPAIPINLSVQPLNASAQLNWDQVVEADSYIIKYGTTSQNYTEQVTSNTNSVTVLNLVNDVECFFAVQSVNTDGTSELSSEVSATPVASTTYNLDPVRS